MNEKITISQTGNPVTSLKVVEPNALREQISQVYDSVARRAFELFENDGGIFGRDLDHWFQAEQELLHPAHVKIQESDDALSVQAEVPGFSADDLEVSLEPRRLTITGKKTTRENRKEGTTVYHERCSNEMMRVIDLPSEVNTTNASATLSNGILKLTMPKVAQAKNTQVAAKAAAGNP
jgi:HSP20 family protein